jgi:hypothetical protein
MRGRACWVAAFIVVLIHCSSFRSRPEPDPTPDRPKVACIADSPLPAMQLRKATGTRLLPEIVRVIGVTDGEDGERWKVLRSGEYDATQWQPWPKEKIQFSGCGPEADAFAQVIAAQGRHTEFHTEAPPK